MGRHGGGSLTSLGNQGRHGHHGEHGNHGDEKATCSDQGCQEDETAQPHGPGFGLGLGLGRGWARGLDMADSEMADEADAEEESTATDEE